MKTIKRKPLVAGILSLIAPGLGQIYGGAPNRGAAILAAAIVIGSLNIMVLPLISIANPAISQSIDTDTRTIWAYWIPRIGHDVLSFWSVVYWVWAVYDAVNITRKNR